MSLKLPENPSLEALRNKAKTLVRSLRSKERSALGAFLMYHPKLLGKTVDDIEPAKFGRREALLVIARQYGFGSWPRLKRYVESAQFSFQEKVRAFVDVAMEGKTGRAKALLQETPRIEKADIVTASILGDAGFVLPLLGGDPSLATREIGPKKWALILYVAYSRFHHESEERAEGLLLIARALLEKGTDANASHQWLAYNDKVRLPVLYAASDVANNPRLTELLLQKGAKPNDGESLIHCCEHRNKECVELLLKYGGDLNQRDETYGETPLSFVLGRDDLSVIDWLLDLGADPNVRCGKRKENALHQACRRGCELRLIEKMLRLGADPLMENSEGVTPFAFALRHDRAEIVALFHERGYDYEPCIEDRLMECFQKSDTDGFSDLSESEPEALGRLVVQESESLIEAAAFGSLEMVKLLVEAGANLAARSIVDSTTALHAACWRGRSEIVAYLLQSGAPVDIRDEMHDSTPLGWLFFGSLYSEHKDMGDYGGAMQAFIDKGVDLDGFVTLEWWAQRSEMASEAIFSVLEPLYGGKFSPQEIERTKPISADALRRMFKEAVQAKDVDALRGLGGKYPKIGDIVDEPLFSFDAPAVVFCKDDPKMISALLELGADLNARSQWQAGGFGILDDNSEEMREFLVNSGAHVDIHAAAAMGDLDRLRVLLEADPKMIHARGGDGQLPLHFAKDEGVVDFLLDRGAEIDALDVDHGSTALQHRIPFASEKSESKRNAALRVCRRLLERGARVDPFAAAALGDVNAIRRLANENSEAFDTNLYSFQAEDSGDRLDAHVYAYRLQPGITPLRVARMYRQKRAYEAIWELCSPLSRFVQACWEADEEKAKRVSRESPGVLEAVKAESNPALADAAWFRELAAVELMLTYGFDPHSRGMDKGTPLDRAAFHGYCDVGKLLLEKDPNPPLDLKNAFGGTPFGCCLAGYLHGWDSGGDRVGFLKLLADSGSDPDGRDDSSASPGWPIRWMAMEGKANAVGALLELGADPALPSKEGLRAIDLAKEGDHLEVVKLLGDALEE
ncbi:MAG: ankyrin repeat domain-containing protein [Verrucomicrobiota bacterium]